MIALNLCQPHYQNLLIIYLTFIAKNVDIKTVNLSVSLKGLKMTKSVKKTQSKSINGLIEKFPNTYKFYNNYLKAFILLLRKGVYPSEFMDSWEKFNETTFPNRKTFYGKLYLEDITDEDYIHAQKVFEELKLKNFGEYHDLYVQSDTLLLADIFENFRNKFNEIYELNPAHFSCALHLD